MRWTPIPLTAWSSALVAAAVGFGGTIALVVQALQNLGASPAQIGSAVAALCLGIAAAGALLSLRLRMPVVLAWSTPGAALLAAAPPGLTWPAAVGAFLSAGVMMIALGALPALARLAERIPASVASAMLAGILLPFCLDLFRIAGTDPVLVIALLAVFIVARRRVPLYALLLVLLAGLALTALRDIAPMPQGALLGQLIAVVPEFDARVLLSLGLPLFMVTLVSQNLPGLVVLRSAGYAPRPAPLLAGAGLATVAAAPFGAHAINLAAITAAICTSSDAHPDQGRRWTVAMAYALIYLFLAAFAPVLIRLFLALTPGAIAVLTGLALVPALTGAIEAMSTGRNGDAAILTFLVTASGVTLLDLGSAFWGMAVGFAASAAAALWGRAATPAQPERRSDSLDP